MLKAEYQLPASRYPVDFRRWPDFAEQHAFNAALLRRAAALPGVSSAALAGNHPLDPGFTNSFTVVGREADGRTWPEISIRRVSPSYFRTVDLKLVDGRLFRDSDNTSASLVAIINAAAARRFFPDREAIGAHIRGDHGTSFNTEARRHGDELVSVFNSHPASRAALRAVWIAHERNTSTAELIGACVFDRAQSTNAGHRPARDC